MALAQKAAVSVKLLVVQHQLVLLVVKPLSVGVMSAVKTVALS